MAAVSAAPTRRANALNWQTAGTEGSGTAFTLHHAISVSSCESVTLAVFSLVAAPLLSASPDVDAIPLTTQQLFHTNKQAQLETYFLVRYL